ncbi:dihydroneopterin aldolase [Puniceibacterium sp. IMCC21224]|uniref:dihydroneopterin aldolase n=1 Tax=Puniceibacterium sp. IMCC21224 TaxID=1618204 RepID=UPI00064D9B39|nr:dihydroneopterin aldolase [Puniceibacterium sp. IMCC21224]KMK66897.1 dihydroneopterin aldolase [Puniceibacterium sp. IMCC21224]
MSTDIRLAFAHPSERAIATAGDAPRDRISLRDHVVEVDIGAFQAERGTTQRISFNVVVEVMPFTGPLDDDVDRILSYDRVTEAIAFELDAERVNLLETLAERIAERILLEPQAMRVFVRIEKLDRGPGALGVEIVRARQDIDTKDGESAQEPPHPKVVYLSNAAISSEALNRWIDGFQAGNVPVILVVGAPDTAPPVAANTMVQRRIDLLSIEQNGWVLAGRDSRCKVVATRTELDWAMKNAQICIWAPSKMVLDATHGPVTPDGEPLALAVWLAEQLSAREFVAIGTFQPIATSIPARVAKLDDTVI